METTGQLAPSDPDDARETYEDLAQPAKVVSTEIAKTLEVADVRDHVTTEVIVTARDALFASLLAVRIGTREEFASWRADFDGEVLEAGSENVDNVAWHAFGDAAVAATFQDEPEAAVATLRRQAFNRLYRDLFYPDQDPAGE